MFIDYGIGILLLIPENEKANMDTGVLLRYPVE